MSFRTLEPEDDQWPTLLGRMPHDVYHLPGYARVCATHEPWPVRLAVAEEAGDAVVLPFMLRDLPAGERGCDVTVPYGYPGPVATSAASRVQAHLLDEMFASFAAMGAVSVFIRCHPFLGVALDALSPFGDVVIHGDQVFLDLATAPDNIESSFRTGHRQNISALRNAGFSLRVDSEADADAFPALYDRNMQRLEADPYYHFPAAYFNEIRASLQENTHFVAAVSPEGETAAIALVFVCGAMGQYHLSCTADKYLKRAPSKLTILGMADLCRDLGVRSLNLGGGVGGRADSLLEFKAGFSGARVPFATARVILDPGRYAKLAAASPAPPDFFPAYRNGM